MFESGQAMMRKVSAERQLASDVYVSFCFSGWWNHESAPFKFTQDYMEIMGGPGSDKWERYA